jgi:hypothetical protein
MIEKFENLGELSNIGLTLNIAQEREVWTKSLAGETTKTEVYKGIWNLNQNHLSCIGTSKYKLIQHNEAIKSVIEVLNNLNLTGTGILRDFGDKIVLEFLFKDKTIEDGEEGIHLGFRIINSYDMSYSLFGELFAYRVACSNGMVLGKAIKDVGFRRLHYGEVDVKKIMREFLVQAINSEDKLKMLVSKAMKDTYEWQLAEEILTKLIYIKKYREKIIELLQNKANLTRWDVYNAITQTATHGEELTEVAKEFLQRQAQKLLLNEPIAVRK